MTVELAQSPPHPVRLVVYDVLGREVHRQLGRPGQRNLFFDVSAWPPGVYPGKVEGYGIFKVMVQ